MFRSELKSCRLLVLGNWSLDQNAFEAKMVHMIATRQKNWSLKAQQRQPQAVL